MEEQQLALKEVPTLKKMVLQKCNQILKKLKLNQDFPESLQKKIPENLEYQIKHDLINKHGTILWYLFGDLETIQDIAVDQNSCLFAISKNHNDLLTIIKKNNTYIAKISTIETSEIYAQSNFDDIALLNNEMEFYNLKSKELFKINFGEDFPTLYNLLYRGKSLINTQNQAFKHGNKKIRFTKFKCLYKKSFKGYYIPLLRENEILDLNACTECLRDCHKEKFGINYRLLKGFHKNEYTVIKIPRKNLIVTASKDNTVKLWNLKSHECISTINRNYPFTSSKSGIWLNLDSAIIFIKIADNQLIFLDAKTGTRIKNIIEKEEISLISMSADNTILALGLFGNTESNKIRLHSIHKILSDLDFAQLALLKLLFKKYKKYGLCKIISGTAWMQIFKSFAVNFQKIIFEKLNLQIICQT